MARDSAALVEVGRSSQYRGAVSLKVLERDLERDAHVTSGQREPQFTTGLQRERRGFTSMVEGN